MFSDTSNMVLVWIFAPLCLRMSLKFYMLAQIAFWLHCYPELYFLKAKKVSALLKKEREREKRNTV